VTQPTYPDGTTLRVWRFAEAPQALRDLSNNGGDEDLVVARPVTDGDSEWLAREADPNRDDWEPWSPFGLVERTAYCGYQAHAADVEGVPSIVWITHHS
jgi:hypothetical protein